MFVSEPYPVIDGKSYDDGTGTISDYWNNTSKLTRNDDGTTSFVASSYNLCNFKVNASTTIAFEDGIAVEFDVIEYTNAPKIDANDGNQNPIEINRTGHWKVVLTDNKMYAYVNGEALTNRAFNTSVSTFNIGFRSSNQETTLKFDNFVLY